MKGIAKRITPYATNMVIEVNKIPQPALRKILKDPRTWESVRAELKDIDPHYELLLVGRGTVDDPEKQLKRYIQRDYGLVVNLSTMRREQMYRYKQLLKYGKPVEVLKRWGLGVTYDLNLSEEVLIERVSEFADDDGHIEYIRDKKVYDALQKRAQRNKLTTVEYLAQFGFTYARTGKRRRT